MAQPLNALELFQRHRAGDQAFEQGGLQNELARFQLAQAPVEAQRKNMLMQQQQQQVQQQNMLAREQFMQKERALQGQQQFRGQQMQLRERQMEQQKVPPGYRMGADGGMDYIPRGPADPAVAEDMATRKKRGEAALALPDAIATADQTILNIDDMIGDLTFDSKGKLTGGKDKKPHPGFQSAIGMTLYPGASLVPGSDTADFMRRLDQIKGGAFLQAFNTLRGGGQITEVEGKKATDAITRMDKSQSEAEFIKAAREFQNIVKGGIERAKGKPQGRAGAQQGGADNDPLGIRQ